MMRMGWLLFEFGGSLVLWLAVAGAKLGGLQGLVVGWTLAVSIEGACAAFVIVFATRLDSVSGPVSEEPAPSL
jgi:hypothetical protein